MILRVIALVTMLLDHIGVVFRPDLPDWLYITLRLTGRLAMPIFCFLIAEGLFHTRSAPRYLARLAVFAVLSEIPFDLAFYGRLWYPLQQNVFFTLALGLAAIAVFDRMLGMGLKYLVVFVPLLAAAAAELLRTDYGLFGVYFIVVFYLCRARTRVMLAAFSAGVLALAVAQLRPGEPFAYITLMHLGSLAFILRYNGKPGRLLRPGRERQAS
ncbi:MAG: conjugal transfer protein TraX, partial [Oscillospiraceae bacterium]|nr:conjugal transfer protein TraX [Oscillospiraceae bacterium]